MYPVLASPRDYRLESSRLLHLQAGKEWLDDVHTKDSATAGAELENTLQSVAVQPEMDM